jgi:hypothetical protein
MPALHELLDQVRDQDTFLAFVRALHADVESGGWEHSTTEAFLEAALAWGESTDMGQELGLPPGPSWRAFAVFLYCGKIYE